MAGTESDGSNPQSEEDPNTGVFRSRVILIVRRYLNTPKGRLFTELLGSVPPILGVAVLMWVTDTFVGSQLPPEYQQSFVILKVAILITLAVIMARSPIKAVRIVLEE